MRKSVTNIWPEWGRVLSLRKHGIHQVQLLSEWQRRNINVEWESFRSNLHQIAEWIGSLKERKWEIETLKDRQLPIVVKDWEKREFDSLWVNYSNTLSVKGKHQCCQNERL